MSSYFTEPSDVDRHAAPETVQTYMIDLESELAAERDAVAELQTQAAEDADTILGLTRKYTAAMFMVERLIDEKGNATAHNSKLLAENKRLEKIEAALLQIVQRWEATSGAVLSKDIGKAKKAMERGDE